MPAPSSFNDYGPITWVRRTPVYLTTILIVLFTVGMFATVFVETAGTNTLAFAFLPELFWRKHFLWQVATYPLIDRPNFFFLFNLFCFYWFGTDVERYLGRSRFTKLLCILVLTPPVLLSGWWLAGVPGGCEGTDDLTIGFFVAFATLYPNLEFRGWITMKWLAFAGIVLSSMNYLPKHDWLGMSTLLATCLVAFGYIRLLQQGIAMELPAVVTKLFMRRPKFKVVPKPAPGGDVHDSIDPLLDKISKHGLSSLTSREREQLQRARENLLKKQN